MSAMGFDQWNALAEMVLTVEQTTISEQCKKMFPGALLAEVSGGCLRLTKVA